MVSVILTKGPYIKDYPEKIDGRDMGNIGEKRTLDKGREGFEKNDLQAHKKMLQRWELNMGKLRSLR